MTSILIDSPKLFADFCERIKGSPFIALDTEFMRNKTYWAQLCVLQIADEGNENIAVVDCLAEGMDLSPLAEILKDQSVVKVVHAARQDVEIFYHYFGFMPYPLFDTQIAAMACGLGDQIGYDVMVKKTVGVEVDKSSRFKDWRNRPLSKNDIAYASGDVIHLTKAYQWIDNFLNEHNRKDWIASEMEKISDEKTYKTDPEWAWLKLKLKGNSVYRSILRELAAFREREAQRRDIPRGFVMKDEMLHALAASTPGDYNALKEAANLYGRNYKGEFANQILAAIKKGIELAHVLPEIKIDKKKSGNMAVVEMLKMLLKMKADEHNVTARLIADSDDLARLSCGEFETSRVLTGWRKSVFGDTAIKFLNGKLSLSVQDGKLKLNDISL